MTSVLYTGAAGRMGTVLRAGLAGEFERVVLFVREEVPVLHAHEEIVNGRLSDLDAMTEAMRGVDVMIHLAAVADEAPWADILESNIEGTYAVFEAARRAGVRRVVYASSHHAIGFYPVTQRVGPADPVRPDSYYGVSKVFGEALARLYHDKWGLEVVSLRIGCFRPEPEDVRQLSAWLSHRDGVELLRRSVLAAGVGFAVVYGVSANTRGWWDNDDAAVIGYVPRDDAEAFAGRFTPDDPAPIVQGGAFADPSYRGGVW
ncbi:NAD(P)-dependent oxidoreductase [Jiangella aurantiaca]|uniref:NAD(P)-dependent oxidoreductase n=1 Tax=Jiangella aurantiaca TaxID=2530373 RepID=A0A4R5ABB4_9ACTN|nr:NAD(P)-dependent oxidoreductase [Jiangella aurantiaca]TDD68456.1 NAD(P)-dependent oxidoreductase [Jiangella aurantiaca]